MKQFHEKKVEDLDPIQIPLLGPCFGRPTLSNGALKSAC